MAGWPGASGCRQRWSAYNVRSDLLAENFVVDNHVDVRESSVVVYGAVEDVVGRVDG